VLQQELEYMTGLSTPGPEPTWGANPHYSVNCRKLDVAERLSYGTSTDTDHTDTDSTDTVCHRLTTVNPPNQI